MSAFHLIVVPYVIILACVPVIVALGCVLAYNRLENNEREAATSAMLIGWVIVCVADGVGFVNALNYFYYQ